ncbi:Disease resistance-like protein DSC1 [Vitis vinifera]|uniref:Disease resistance-like protein DSC1 n=1 Tax=Vitis vinifera TaxID=29760 RepID=A0A438C6B1_VITVI|nr:Disease resistance-like protein DSC1 [Vitis vinifera]
MAFANPQSQRASFSSISTPGWNYDVFLSFMGEDDCPSCAGWRPEAHVIEEITSTVWKSLNREFLHVEKNLVGMDRRRASSTCTSIGSWDYEAFLSFKGEDTRYNFTDHLYAALYQKGIRTFGLDEIRDSSEVDYIKDITHVIWKRFSHKLLHVDKNLIGMDYHLEEMEEIFPQMMDSISNDVRMVGIYGFRGIEDSKSQGLLHLQKQLFHYILPRGKNFISTIDERIHMIKDRLCFKKVLLVLDDVDDLNQLEALAESGIRVLGDKCLISIVDNKIWMHDLLQQMGQDIVGQEFPKEPGKWSRLCYPEVGTEAVKGILLNLSIPKPIHITTESFVMMNNLRLLKIYSDHEFASMGEHSKVKLSKDFEFPSYELRYLCWQGYPLESLPSSFYAEDLVELDMCYSSLKQLWESDMLLEKLNTIRLSSCQRLIEIPDISVSAPNLEKLILDGCSSLVKVHPSIGKLSKLILLNLKNCKKLSSFPSIIDMEALEILNLSGCSELKKFPDIQGNMEHLLELYLASTAIKELPSSIEHLTGLVLLDLKRCKNLKSLPTSVCKLESLEYLFLSGCSKLENFPEMMEEMENLKELLLDGTSIEGLPSSIDRLKGLVLLNLRNCKNLVSLPKGMCTLTSLETLIVSGCSQLNNLPKNLGTLQHLAQLHADGTAITQPPDSIVLLRNLKVLIYPGCKRLAPTSLDLSDCKLIEGAILNSICSLISLKKLDLSRNDFLSIPAGISELTSLKDLRLGQYQSLTEIPSFDQASETYIHTIAQHFYQARQVGIPEWIWHQNVGSSIKIELPTD